MPNNTLLKCISWNVDTSYLAVGGNDGIVKIIKLETSGNLSNNLTLEGHNSNISNIGWNNINNKLSSCDVNGLIIVWMFHKNMWFEEMINNRNKSIVKDLKWSNDGNSICLIYEDGAVILGSLNGNKIWDKELGIELLYVEWSPDSRLLLFATESEIHIYDILGNFMNKLPIYAIERGSNTKVAGIEWYNGLLGVPDPSLPYMAIAFENGRVQIMRHDTDDLPVLIDCEMNLKKIKWSPNGNILALAGSKVGHPTSQGAVDNNTQLVQFYTPLGKHLRTLKIPGANLGGISWEGDSLRLALAIDSYIYFANLRPDYKWGFFSNTILYTFNKIDRAENCVCFWDIKSDEKHVKYVKKLVAIRAGGDYCVLTTKADDSSGQFILILCNSIGSPVDSKYIDIEPLYIHMTSQFIIAANNQMVYIWYYKSSVPNNLVSSSSTVDASPRIIGNIFKDGITEKLFHIDDSPNAIIDSRYKPKQFETQMADPICAITCSNNCLIVARASGLLIKYTLPNFSLECKFMAKSRPQSLFLNCNSTRLAVIDISGLLLLHSLEVQPDNKTIGSLFKFERKDCWDVIWSDDNQELFACMEKAKMYVFRGLNPEEPANCNGYLASFSNLCIQSVSLDDVLKTPEAPLKEMLTLFDTKTLRDTRDLLATTPIQEAYQFVDDNPHPRLWKLVAEAALEQLNFLVADKAFVRCHDYQGIQFVKRLKLFHDKFRQKAEVAAYFKRFDEAESILLKNDSKELAIELRCRLGDWFRVVQLIQGGAGDDALLQDAYCNIGDYYADRHRWDKAVMFYTKGKQYKALVNCNYILEDFNALEKLALQLPEGHEILSEIGEKLMSVGLCSEAVSSFLKGGNIKSAIDCCVLLNQWDQAVSLAGTHNFPQIELLLSKYASYLLEKNKTLQAIDLYRKANKHTEAAKLLSQIAKEAAKTKMDPVRAKKLYVLAAIEIDRFRKRVLDQSVSATTNRDGITKSTSAVVSAHASTVATMNALLQHDTATGSDKTLDMAWRGAEAYHFLILAQKQIYAGDFAAAMKTSLRLVEYDDMLEAKEIYSLVALSSLYNKHYNIASKAFIKLEVLEDTLPVQLEKYSELAVKLFIRNPPEDPLSQSFSCPNMKCSNKIKDWATSCSDCGMSISACIVSGKALITDDVITCRECRHKAYSKELRAYNNCPLCHASLKR